MVLQVAQWQMNTDSNVLVQTAQFLVAAVVSVPRASATKSSCACAAYFGGPTSITNKEVE